MNEELEHINFDTYLITYMYDFIREKGHHIRINDGEIRLNPDVKFSFFNAPNRSGLVSAQLWESVIKWHLKRTSEN